jgi:putative redox protein
MALRDIIVATQADLRANAQNGQAAFSVDSRQVEGLRSETKIRQFSLTVDEPPTLGGSDAGPNPVELVLAALATCQEITYRAYATALGIPLESVSVKLDGALDLRGFFAVSDDVRPGFTGVEGTGDAQEPGEPRAARKAQGSGGRPLPSAGRSSRSRSGGIAAHD